MTVGTLRNFDQDLVAERHRRWPDLAEYDVNLYPHPYVVHTYRPGSSSRVYSIDQEGFRLSTSPQGPVDSTSWLAGGGGLVVGASTAFGVGASSDAATLPSRLAEVTGVPQLNLGVPGGNSMQQLHALMPFLHAASTVVVFSGWTSLLAQLRTKKPNGVFGATFFERIFRVVETEPLFNIAELITGTRTAEQVAPPAPRTEGAPVEAESLAGMEAALRHQLRDLALLARAVPDSAQLVFCLQPLADPLTRDLVAEEQESFDYQLPVFGPFREFVAKHWESYSRQFAAGCAEIGVRFVDVSADRFEGWSFYDATHLTDHGYQQAAGFVTEALDTTAA
ncbi:hypothetical protein AB0I00_41870 [Streptomyces sp. NPDC050803]|uniref:hypothetical protein n=1 Tax=unclassified Streptomyces TaxID=2593676 RepID=UPI00341B60F2